MVGHASRVIKETHAAVTASWLTHSRGSQLTCLRTFQWSSEPSWSGRVMNKPSCRSWSWPAILKVSYEPQAKLEMTAAPANLYKRSQAGTTQSKHCSHTETVRLIYLCICELICLYLRCWSPNLLPWVCQAHTLHWTTVSLYYTVIIVFSCWSLSHSNSLLAQSASNRRRDGISELH